MVARSTEPLIPSFAIKAISIFSIQLQKKVHPPKDEDSIEDVCLNLLADLIVNPSSLHATNLKVNMVEEKEGTPRFTPVSDGNNKSFEVQKNPQIFGLRPSGEWFPMSNVRRGEKGFATRVMNIHRWRSRKGPGIRLFSWEDRGRHMGCHGS